MTTTSSIDDLVMEPQQQAYEPLAAGTYTAIIDKLERFDTNDYQTGFPITKLRVTYRVIEPQDWVDETINQLIAIERYDDKDRDEDDKPRRKPVNMSDSRAGLYKIWSAAMGEQPVVGGKYPLRNLQGRRVSIAVGSGKPKPDGKVYMEVQGVTPPPQPRRRGEPVAAAPAARTTAADDDDLADA